MDPARDLDATSRHADEPAPSPTGGGFAQQALSGVRHAARRLILWAHHQADRMDLIPTEFGDETFVDHADARSVAREWLRQAKLWASYNPEEMLALKVGAAMLGAALLALVILVAAIR